MTYTYTEELYIYIYIYIYFIIKIKIFLLSNIIVCFFLQLFNKLTFISIKITPKYLSEYII